MVKRKCSKLRKVDTLTRVSNDRPKIELLDHPPQTPVAASNEEGQHHQGSVRLRMLAFQRMGR